ncbi:LOW QUALITY PROTEIN: heat shock 70 kDa protein 1A-like [Tiliqua scincoides]|uniref:LOW QUALITY PROTEIN: heat shock 70 kDa protein 1A-like n=1 Tax=Tiliqua scincoides TaxID=71010 RepID=UPI003462E44F
MECPKQVCVVRKALLEEAKGKVRGGLSAKTVALHTSHFWTAWLKSVVRCDDEACSSLGEEGDRTLASPSHQSAVPSAKRLTGRKYEGRTIQEEAKLWPFTEGSREAESLSVLKGPARETSAVPLAKMKQMPEAYLGLSISHTLVTVPAYFNDARRQATADAEAMAGLPPGNHKRAEPWVKGISMGSDLSHEYAGDHQSPTTLHRTPQLQTGASRARPKGPAVGIDLGTTYSCVAVCQKGKVDIIANDHGNRTTPSYVAFTDRERLVGEAAELQIGLNPENTVFGAKRLIGRRFDDSVVQSDLKHWPFQVVGVSGKKAKVQVSYRGMERAFYPEEISAMVLYKLRQSAEAYLGRPVTQAVITVPAYFDDAQRQATIDAGAIAGFKVLKLINEPTAAAIAYDLQGSDQRRASRNILVFDLGGGTFDVSILTAQDGVFEVKATAGDTHLGGEDFDQRLVDHLAQEFKRKYQEDVGWSKKAMQRLKVACEKAKRTLSSNVTAVISIDALYKGVDFHTTVTRASFEDLCADLFQATLGHVERALEDARIKKTQVHSILLVGGSTRIPMIQRLLSKFFDGQELVKAINPDEAVAQGAAVQAAVLTGHRYQNLQNLVLLDVTPVSLGLETAGGFMDMFVKRNTPIPTKETRSFTTTEDNQDSLCLQIYEGERMMIKHNHLLGTLKLSGLQPAPRCVSVITVTFEIDHNNILTVSATEMSTGKSKQLVITDTRGRLDREEMERLIHEEEQQRAREKVEKEKMEALNSLESTTFQLKRAATEGRSLDERAKRRVLEMCEETAAWIEGNQLAPKKEYEERRRELEDVGYSIISHFTTGAEKS